jgi:hypothetical protein
MQQDYLHQEVEEDVVKEKVKKGPAKKEKEVKKNAADLNQGTKRTDR